MGALDDINGRFGRFAAVRAAQQLWYKSTEAWSAHMSDLRDARYAGGSATGGRIWGQMYGQTDTRDAALPDLRCPMSLGVGTLEIQNTISFAADA